MKLEELYTGQLVKSNKYDGVHEIIRIDDFSMSIWTRPLNSIDFKLNEMQAADLQEAKRG